MQAFVEIDGETLELDIDENGNILNSTGFVIPVGAPITLMESAPCSHEIDEWLRKGSVQC
jgi:hypothetical protein